MASETRTIVCRHPAEAQFLIKPATRLGQGIRGCRACRRQIAVLEKSKSVVEELVSLLEYFLQDGKQGDPETSQAGYFVGDAVVLSCIRETLEEVKATL